MRVAKDFEAKVAIGEVGVALLSITETLSPHSPTIGTDIHPNLVLADITENGMEEWVGYWIKDVPDVPGVYTFRGSATFDEDSADYSITCDEQSN